MRLHFKALALTLGMTLAAANLSFAQTTIVIRNLNAPGVGFNDPTPAAPVGGNTGTTVGEQRRIAFQYAADIWGAKLDSSIIVRIRAEFTGLACTATAATLGSAGAWNVWRDFPSAPKAGTWYPEALANKLAFQDLSPDVASDDDDDISARFNANIGQAGCLTGNGWYYGLDTNTPPNRINLVTVLLHEFAHGLGFQSFANGQTGRLFGGLPDIYSTYYHDNTTNKDRLDMTDTERIASGINPRNVVWVGPAVTAKVPQVLQVGMPLFVVSSPLSIAGDYQVGAAAFGPALTAAGVTGNVVVANDAANVSGLSTTDACTAITNASAIAGRIALVDRGTCGFVVKALNVQNAGAIAMLVADNVAGGPPAGITGVDPTIVIPSVRITLDDGNKIKAALAATVVTGKLGLDTTIRAGADRNNHTMLYTPNPYQSGSSISHWDTSTAPNQLMEPAINADLRLNVDAPHDLTRSLLRDIGWYPDGDLDALADDDGDQCLKSDLRSTVIIGGSNTGVNNTFFTNGCSITDLVAKCKVDAKNHGAYVSCGASLTNQLKGNGFISGSDKGAIQSAIARDK